MKLKTTTIIGYSRNMSELKDDSVHLVVTSPPYWQLKDYGNSNQIGFNDSYEDSSFPSPSLGTQLPVKLRLRIEI